MGDDSEAFMLPAITNFLIEFVARAQRPFKRLLQELILDC